MALIFGSGEPIARVRRGLDIKGKVALSLDEVVVPTAKTLDLTVAPIRRSPVRWWSSALVPAVVGEFGRWRIFHQINIDQLIDNIWLSPVPATVFEVGMGPAGAAGGIPARTTEIMDADNGGVIARRVGITTFADSVTPTSLSFAFLRVFAQGTEALHLKVELVIPAMPDAGVDPVTNAPTVTIESRSANEAFSVTASGLWYDSLPVNFRT